MGLHRRPASADMDFQLSQRPSTMDFDFPASPA
jgi:hypothetical protein